MVDHQQLNVRVPAEVAERVDAIASAEQRTLSGAIRVLIAEALRNRIARVERAGGEAS